MSKQKPSAGFTILEILVATILISILVSSGIYFVDVSKKREVVEDSTMHISMLRNFPSALMQVYQIKNTFVGVTAQNLIDTANVIQDKPVQWAIASEEGLAPGINHVTLIFTFKNAMRASNIKDFLELQLKSNFINSVAVNSNDGKKLQVKYAL